MAVELSWMDAEVKDSPHMGRYKTAIPTSYLYYQNFENHSLLKQPFYTKCFVSPYINDFANSYRSLEVILWESYVFLDHKLENKLLEILMATSKINTFYQMCKSININVNHAIMHFYPLYRCKCIGMLFWKQTSTYTYIMARFIVSSAYRDPARGNPFERRLMKTTI